MIEHFDAAKYFLGKLCKYGHEWNESGQSLRTLANRSCYQCCLLASQRWKQRNPEKTQEYSREQWGKNPRKRSPEYYRDYYRRNAEGYKRRNAKYRAKRSTGFVEGVRRYSQLHWKEQYLKHRDEVHAYRRQRRAKSRGVRVEPYTAQDLGDRLKLFGGKCAYCQQLLDSAGEPHWDHVVPILRNGVDGLSNLVPSCKHCNCRKWAHDAYAWYSRQPFFSREQWQLINEACSYPSEHQQKPISE